MNRQCEKCPPGGCEHSEFLLLSWITSIVVADFGSYNRKSIETAYIFNVLAYAELHHEAFRWCCALLLILVLS